MYLKPDPIQYVGECVYCSLGIVTTCRRVEKNFVYYNKKSGCRLEGPWVLRVH